MGRADVQGKTVDWERERNQSRGKQYNPQETGTKVINVYIYYLTIKYNNSSKQYLAFKKIIEGCRVYLYTSKYSRPNRASGNLDAKKQVHPIPLAERESQSRSQETKGPVR
jgi:hypothetical protein